MLFGTQCFFIWDKYKVQRHNLLKVNIKRNLLIHCLNRSQWHSNPHFLGSYSFYSVESDAIGVTIAKLAAPILDQNAKPLIQFAGEATDSHYYSTVHGAVGSGWREAQRLIDLYTCPKSKL